MAGGRRRRRWASIGEEGWIWCVDADGEESGASKGHNKKDLLRPLLV